MSLSGLPPGGQDRNVAGLDDSLIFTELARPLGDLDFTDRSRHPRSNSERHQQGRSPDDNVTTHLEQAEQLPG